jgi:phage I-like protein
MKEPLLITSEYSVLLDLKPHAPGAEQEVPISIQYMPGGKSTITPSVNGEAKQISVTVNKQTADVLQSELAELLTQNVRPFIDFEHAGGRAAAIPKRFFWDEGHGVMLELDWTNSGKNAVSGRDYSYFSPTFMLNEKGDPSGLPKSGAIGSLVNNPAFRDFKPIYAHQAGYFDAEGHIYFTDDAGYHDPHKEFYVPELAQLIAATHGGNTGNQNKTKDTMSDKITAKLVSLGFITEADSSDPEKVTAALEVYSRNSRKGTENAELVTARARIAALEAAAETQRVEAINREADLLIEAAV